MTQIQSFNELILPAQLELPQVIFFDAMGTLFGLQESVGDIYRKLAEQFGVKVNSQQLNQAFFKTFKTASPLAFGESDPIQLQRKEYEWWYAIAAKSFAQVTSLEKFSDFDLFFQQLYYYFATEKPWFVYPDVLLTLTYLQKQGIELGIISNFDSRLYAILTQLQLNTFFSKITISSNSETAKPDAKIFKLALQKFNCLPHQAWHIGDSLEEDYNGAKTVGIKAFLVKHSNI